MASVTNKVSMENLVPEASVMKSNKVYKLLLLVTAVACLFAITMMALFIWQVTKSPSSNGSASNLDDDSSWSAAQLCPKIPLLLSLPSPLPQDLKKALEKLDAYLESLITDNGLPAISANLFYLDRILWTGHYGKKTLGGEKPGNQTRYRIGSITKVFAVLMLYKMYEEGLIDSIDDPLSKYAPNFHINNPFNGENITLRQMASQMSGLPREAPCVTCVANETTEEQMMYLRNRSLVVEPGTMPSYSNLAYALLGRLLPERLANTTFEKWITEKFLIPLGLKNTGFEITEDVQKDMAYSYDKQGKILPFMNIGWLSPSGQMYSTMDDMAQIGMLLVESKKHKNLLKSSSLREILAPVHISSDGQTIMGSPWEMVFHKHFLVRTKGGAIDNYIAMMSLVPELKFGFNVIVSSHVNLTAGTGIANEILDRVYRKVLPVFNDTLFKLNTNGKFPGNSTFFCGTYNATQVDVISGTVENFLVTIKENNLSLDFISPLYRASLYYINDRLLQSRRYSTCLAEILTAVADVYFLPKGGEGKSTGFTIPGEGISAFRIKDK